MRNEELQNIDDAHLGHPPMYLDLYYLITPYGLGKNITLGRIMQFFSDHSILMGSDLGIDTDEEIRILLNPLSLDDLTKIWSAFKNASFNLSIGYLVTPVRIDSTMTTDVHRVIS